MKKVYILVSFLFAWALAGTVLAASLNLSRPIAPVVVPEDKIIVPIEVKGINPQPEPPKVLSAPTGEVEVEIEFDDSPTSKRERVQLDPQPEPPKSVDFEIEKKGKLEDLPTMKGLLLGGKETETKSLEFETESSEKLGKIFVLDSQMTMQGTKVLFSSSSTGSTTEFKMKMALPAFFNGLTRALNRDGASTTINKLDLKVVDGKLTYEAEASESVRLLGLIPLKVNTKIIIDAEKEKVVGVNRPWYSFLASKANLSDLKLLPNLKVAKLSVVSSNGGVAVEGQPGKIVAEITNDGATYLIVSPPIFGGGHRMDFYGDSQWLGAYVPVMFLKPGESTQFDYNWKSVKCGSVAKVEAALDPSLEEATKDDNTATVTVVCGN